jgi:hypothetical protein
MKLSFGLIIVLECIVEHEIRVIAAIENANKCFIKLLLVIYKLEQKTTKVVEIACQKLAKKSK